MAVKITVKPNGSLRVEVERHSVRIDLGGRPSISLCRCGHSKDKPFCDHSHREHGFASEVKARSLGPVPPKL